MTAESFVQWHGARQSAEVTTAQRPRQTAQSHSLLCVVGLFHIVWGIFVISRTNGSKGSEDLPGREDARAVSNNLDLHNAVLPRTRF